MSDEKKQYEFIVPGMVSGAAAQFLVPMDIGPDAPNETMHLEVPVTTLRLDGLVKRPEGTPVPWVEPQSDLPADARERLRSLDDYRLAQLVEWLDGSSHLAGIVAYAKAVMRGRVPLEDRIVCGKCGTLYEAWTKRDEEHDAGELLRDGWVELRYRCEPKPPYNFTDEWKDLCPKCPPTPEELAEQDELNGG